MTIPIPKPTLFPTTAADLPVLSNLVHSCKLALPINRLLFTNWPNDAAQKPLYANAVESAFKDPAVECLKIVGDDHDDDDESGHIIVGYVGATRKRSEVDEDGERNGGDGRKSPPNGIDPDVYKAVVDAVAEITDEMKGVDHFQLNYICVTPTSRRQGIGSRLVQVFIDKAKAEGIPLSVCAEPAAYEFFAKLGFRETRHVNIDLAKWAPPYSGFGVFRLVGMVWSVESSGPEGK